MVRVIVTLLVAGIAGLAALLISFDMKGSPLQAQTEMASRVAGRDPLAQNSYYASAVFDSAEWFEATVLPTVAGLASGLTALAVGLSIRQRLIVCGAAGIGLVAILHSTPGRAMIAVLMFSFATLGVASLRELRRTAAL